MKKKVIIVTYKEFENFEYEKYGVDILEKYFEIEVWSLSKFFLGEHIKTKDVYSGQKEVATIKEFIRFLGCYSPRETFLFFLFPPALRKVYYLEAIVSLMGFRYSMAYCQPVLTKYNNGTLKEDMAKRKKDYMNVVLNAFFPPTFNFVATAVSYKEFPSIWSVKRQNNIMIHTLDYDVFLKIKGEHGQLVKGPYILFLDESYVAHYDYQVLDVTPPFKRQDDYYVPMRKFFDYIEQIMGYRVVIAEHPRAHYCDRSIYGNREIIRGQTAILIRDAELVLCHISVAMDYIILFQKKFIVLYLDEIMQFYEWENYYIPLFHYLKIKGLNISKSYNYKIIENVIADGASKLCKKYRHYFIKANGTKESLFFEIVAEHILKEMNGKNEVARQIGRGNIENSI